MDKALSTHEFTSFTNPISNSQKFNSKPIKENRFGKMINIVIGLVPLVPPEEQKNMTIPDESIQSFSDSDHDSKRERIHPHSGQLTAALPPSFPILSLNHNLSLIIGGVMNPITAPRQFIH
ncbi:hypothetical protein CEXT_138391 [Caerostris extrusa]|uniref:Uncharacterized protein n=1 Tax=Caerostris extrusa TaxID=172846 RepID=A0AAV4VPG3_CAEEX|nr:hypothetical protein CEXT_138391 [Caerostris extrusa]